MKVILLIIFAVGMVSLAGIQYSYASCTATIIPEPCFDSYSGSSLPLTEKSIMQDYARNIELNYGDWQMSNRDWSNEDEALDLPAIICTEFVADGMMQYRMAKWVDSHTISSFENYRDDSLCDRWLSPIDDKGNLEIVLGSCACQNDPEKGCFAFGAKWNNATHYIDNTFCKWELVSEKIVTGSYELEDPLCIGGRGIIKNENCEMIGKYDIQTGIPIVHDKSECDKLDGTWYDDRGLCDSKYAPVEYRFQFGPAIDVYDESEEMRMASDKVYTVEESMGGGSGTAIFDEYSFQPLTIILGVALGLGSFIALMVFWRRK